ncbi:MAG TPA: HPP family protein [Stellaceae bacterium]|jgi:CBS domain-containing membrane protein|nr:HPP family protein [Stellaceae bacterium]
MTSWFKPILPGATLRDRAIASLGALIAIALTGFICGLVIGRNPTLPLIVAPLGASAVLLFAVPSSPLAQPWSIIGGNTVSAYSGVLVSLLIHDPVLAIGASVALAITVMSLTRCLHPPGGAAAMTAVLGGPVVGHWGFLFPLVPVALNSIMLVGLGIVFSKLARRSYPHKAVHAPANTHGTADPPPPARIGVSEADLDAALSQLRESFDIDRADLAALIAEAEAQALARAHGRIRCRDIMSRDVITANLDTTAEQARDKLLAHNIRALPVIDETGRLAGVIGLREVARATGPIAKLIRPAVTATPEAAATGLTAMLTDGHTHAVVITDPHRRVLGLITQTDLLAAMAHGLVANGNTPLGDRAISGDRA